MFFVSYRYHSLAPMYYRGAQAAIVVYDIQNQDSFQRAKTWVKELHKQVSVIIAGHLHSSASGWDFCYQGQCNLVQNAPLLNECKFQSLLLFIKCPRPVGALN